MADDDRRSPRRRRNLARARQSGESQDHLIAYTRLNTEEIRYAFRDAAGWHRQTVTTGSPFDGAAWFGQPVPG